MNHERRIAQSFIAAGITVFLALGSLGWLRLAGLAVIALAFYVWKKRSAGLLVGSTLAALAVYRLLGGFGTLLISLAVSGFIVARLAPDQRRLARSVALASTGAVLLLAFTALGLLTSVWFGVLLIAVGGYMFYIERQSGQWVTLDTLRDVADTAKAQVYGSHLDAHVDTGAKATSNQTTGSQTTPASDPPTKPATDIDAANTDAANTDAANTGATNINQSDAYIQGDIQSDTQPETATDSPDVATETVGIDTTSTATPDVFREPVSDAPETAADTPAAAPNMASADGYAALLEQLFAWRERAATTYNRAPGQILRDDILEEIASVQPKTLDALGEIRGIGSKKLERYGADILNVLRDHHQQA